MEKENDITKKQIRYIKGVGPKIAALLNKKGLNTVEDLFYFLPNRYVDKRSIKNINANIIIPIPVYKKAEPFILTRRFLIITSAIIYGTDQYQLVIAVKCTKAGFMT